MRTAVLTSLILFLFTASPRRLFDGKTLTGWHKNPQRIGHGTGGSWTVVDGAITGEQDPPGSGNGGILLTDQKFRDFEVTFEVMPDWGVCSGFFLRSSERGQCYQIMIDYHDGGNVGEIYREGLDGKTNRTFQFEGVYADADRKTLTGIKATQAEKNDQGAGGSPMFPLENWGKIWKLGKWNRIRARVSGNPPTITTYVNGTMITRYQSDQKFEKELGEEGALAVQVHGGKAAWPDGAKIRFRRIQVRDTGKR